MAPQVSKGMPARNQRVVARCLGPVSQRTVTQACGQNLKLHALIHACPPPLPPHCVIPATTGSGLVGSDQSYEGCTSRTSVVRVVATRRSNLENLEDGFCSIWRLDPRPFWKRSKRPVIVPVLSCNWEMMGKWFCVWTLKLKSMSFCA